jgi:hypothetical protein
MSWNWFIGGAALYILLNGKGPNNFFGNVFNRLNSEAASFGNTNAFPGERKDMDAPCSRPISNDLSSKAIKEKIAQQGSVVKQIGNATA